MPSIATMATSTQPGHDNCPPTPAASGEPLVTINGSPIMCVSHQFQGHSCGHPFNHPYHVPTIAQGSSVVSINGKPVSFDGASISGCPVPIKVQGGDSLVDVPV